MGIVSGWMRFRAKAGMIAKVYLKSRTYARRFRRYAFRGNKCASAEQYEAVITRWYHTIEKGLAYVNFRAGFGARNIDALLTSMENYAADGYDKNAFSFRTALSTLQAYIRKNKAYGVENPELEKRIAALGGAANEVGGVIRFVPPTLPAVQSLGYKDFVESRHSMRHFAGTPVDMGALRQAIELAQHTPSACNRQGWRVIVVHERSVLEKVRGNQNGNEGFGQEFDSLLLVTADVRAFNLDRELFQPYVDGGMYAQSILNALHYYGIASVPLSASLRKDQEANVRQILGLNEAEVLIMFIGIGNYPAAEECQTTRSERHEARYQIV